MNKEKYILFDVGANFGTNSLLKTKNNTYYETWAFEPTPELVYKLKEESKEYSDRYHVIQLALSDFDGFSKFNIASTNFDWGCSSLNDFNENLDKTWPGREDLKTERTIIVSVSRLDSWFESNNINLSKIDYFHCDTQGSDLKVLKGMGLYIKLIQRGVVECPNTSEVSIYKQNHSKEEMIDFLLSNGFRISNITPNDHFGQSLNASSTVDTANEINIYFERV